MTFRILSTLSFCIMFAACGTTSESQAKFTLEEEEMQAQNWQQMMDIQNRIMGSVADLEGATQTLQALADRAAVEANDFHPRAMNAIAGLKETETQLSDWLTKISEQKLDTLQARYDHAGVLSFIDKEVSRIEAIEEQLQQSLKTAKSLIKERNPDTLKIE